MTKMFVAAAVAAFAIGSQCFAASTLNVVNVGGDSYVATIDIEDTLDVDVVDATFTGSFLNPNAAGFGLANGSATEFNGGLVTPTFLGGLGYSSPGNSVDSSTAFASVGPLGTLWTTAPTPLASLVLAEDTTASFVIDLFRAGVLVETITGTFPETTAPVIPEPTSVLAFAGLLGLGLIRRR